jgi:hypothetical protein
MSGSGGGGSATVIREFLISIGYAEHGRREFNESMVVLTNQAIELGRTVGQTARAVVDAFARINDSLEQLYFQSRRTNATVESIEAIGFAASRTGSSVAAAASSMDNFARFIRTTPGAEGFMRGLGVATRDANGSLRETGDLFRRTITQLNTRFKPGDATAMAYAGVFGIDERTLLAGADRTNRLMEESYRQMARSARVDLGQAASVGHEVQNAFGLLGAAVDLLQKKFATAFGRAIAQDVDRFRKWLVGHFDDIVYWAERLGNGLLHINDVLQDWGRGLARIVSDVGGEWNKLDDGTKKFLLSAAAIVGGVALIDAGMKASLPWKIVALVGRCRYSGSITSSGGTRASRARCLGRSGNRRSSICRMALAVLARRCAASRTLS